jgi:cysteine dioxygenase
MKTTLENFLLEEDRYPLPGPLEKKRYLLEKDSESELILMIWGQGSQSPIHDHAGSGCWTRLLKGSLKEKMFQKDPLILISESNFDLQTISYVDKDEGFHQLINETHSLVYTLHFYQRPLSHCNVYDEETKAWSVLANHYDVLENAWT